MKKQNKKGIVDIVFVVIFLFIFAVVAIIGLKFFQEINDKIQESSNIDDESKQIAQDTEDVYPNLWDALFVTALVLIYVFLLVSSFFIDTHPIFFFVALVMIGIVLLIGGIMSNVFTDIISSKGLSEQAGEFTATVWIFQHFIQITLVMIFTIFVVLYAKFRLSTA